VLLEAQASGLPVLVASCGNARDYMRPDLTGTACHAHDVLGFAARASELLIDTVRRRAMAEAARRFAQARSWPAALGPVYGIYRTASQPAPSTCPRRGRSRHLSVP
jgi:glycosyltransferase involved in cell wall biosynthesis